MSANPYLTPAECAVLEKVRIGVAGAGGLGSNCAMHLVRSGIRHLVVADFDVVGESNLNRQFFFRDQLGMKKVDALKANLLRIDPEADVQAVDVRLDAASTRELFENCDIVVEAFDAVEAKTMILSTLMPLGKEARDRRLAGLDFRSLVHNLHFCPSYAGIIPIRSTGLISAVHARTWKHPDRWAILYHIT